MKKFYLWELAALFSLVLGVNNVSAAQITLEDWIFNIDGTTHEAFFGDPLPTTGNLVDGLGVLSLEISGTGNRDVIGFFDFEIDQFSNTFFNESGAVVGTPDVGQSWEIDEPKFFFGDIIDNVLAGALDNTNNVPAGLEDDVGFALGWNFNLLEDQVATIDFIFTDTLPDAEFFLEQYDPDSNFSLYAYSTLNIDFGLVAQEGPTQQVDEPRSILLMMLGSLGLFVFRLGSRRKNVTQVFAQ